MRLTALPTAMRDFGVEVVEMAGWQTRGREFPRAPIGGIDHWTVGSSRGELPSGAVLTYGRSDLPGPLCNVARGRRVGTARPRAFMVASGKANHGGRGSWPTSSGRMATSNYDLFGLEVEYRPYDEPIRDEDLEVDALIHAAAAQVCGYTANDVAGHWEYATPRGRKVDRKTVGGPRLRELVAHAIDTRGDDMPLTDTDVERIANAVLFKVAGTKQNPPLWLDLRLLNLANDFKGSMFGARDTVAALVRRVAGVKQAKDGTRQHELDAETGERFQASIDG